MAMTPPQTRLNQTLRRRKWKATALCEKTSATQPYQSVAVAATVASMAKKVEAFTAEGAAEEKAAA